MDFLLNSPGDYNSPFFQCPNGCAASMHGRFEEITYQVDGSENHQKDTSELVLCQSNGKHHGEIWNQCQNLEFRSPGSRPSHSDEERERLGQSCSPKGEKSAESEHPDEINDFENDFQWELRWLKAKYLLELREVKEISSKSSTPRSFQGDVADERFSQSFHLNLLQADGIQRVLLRPETAENSYVQSFQKISCPISTFQRARNCEAMEGSYDTQNLATAKNCLTASLLPTSLQRTTSLPVDAVYI